VSYAGLSTTVQLVPQSPHADDSQARALRWRHDGRTAAHARSSCGPRRAAVNGAVSQPDLFEWAAELKQEEQRVRAVNDERSGHRGFVIFATDPTIDPDSPEYRHVYATEAASPAQAIAKIRPLTGDRRLRAYLATGTHSDQLATAQWVP
jgi:hypothetical protein